MKSELVNKLTAYLEGDISLEDLVGWAEALVLDGFEATPVEEEIIFRLGVADAANFELSWEELARILNRLGYKVQLRLQPA